MPWNPFKSKKGKADKAGQPIKTGFHPIDLDALGKEDQGGSGDRKAGSGGGESGTADAARADPNAPPQAIAESPRSSASAMLRCASRPARQPTCCRRPCRPTAGHTATAPGKRGCGASTQTLRLA